MNGRYRMPEVNSKEDGNCSKYEHTEGAAREPS